MTLLTIFSLPLAQAVIPEGPAGLLGSPWVFMILIFGIFYFMLLRPQQRKEKERKAMIEEVKTGQRVMFSGGNLGTVSNVKEGTFVVKIADGVKIEVARGGIQRVLEKGEKVGEVDSKD